MNETLEQFKDEFEQAERYYAYRNNQMESENKLIRGEYNCFAIKGQPLVKPDLPKREVEIAADHVATGHTSIDLVPCFTQKEKEVAEKLTNAYELSYVSSDEHLNTDPDAKLASYIASNGGGVMKMLWRPEASFPIVFIPINPAHFYPGPGGNHYYESYELPCGEVKAMVGALNAKSDKKPWNDTWFNQDGYKDDYKQIKWIERWTDKHRYYFLSTANIDEAVELSEVQENHFGCVPYAWRATNIASGDYSDPSGLWVSILRGKETIYEAYARVLTAMDYHIRLNAYGEYWVSEDVIDAFKSPQSPGTYRPVPRDVIEGKGAMARPEMNLNADFYPFMQRLFDHANDFGVNTILAGVAGGDSSGRRYESELGAAEKKIVPLRKCFESIKSQCGTMMAKVLANPIYNTDGISLDGKKSIRASEVQPNTRFIITKEYKDPQLDIERIELGLRLRERYEITHAEFVEDYLKITKDGTAHLGEILAERAMTEDQQMMMAMTIRALQDQGLDEEAAQLQQAMQQVSLGQNAASQTQTVDGRALPPQGGGMNTPGAQRMAGAYAG